MRPILLLGDCEARLSEMGEASVDLVVTSPPYDNLRRYNDDSFDWNHSKFLAVAKQLYRVLKEGGVLVWNVNDQTIDGGKTCTSFRQVLAFTDTIGFKLNDTMIWRKTNPMPQVKQPRYAPCFEYMFVFCKGYVKTFNPIMRECKCAGQNYDSTCKNMGGEDGRTEKHFTINSQSVDYNIWDIAISQNKTGHPAVFPYDLAERHIKSWSNKGDVVMDPFLGSGTTGIAAVMNDRKFIGIEKNPDYFEISTKRVMDAYEIPKQQFLFPENLT